MRWKNNLKWWKEKSLDSIPEEFVEEDVIETMDRELIEIDDVMPMDMGASH